MKLYYSPGACSLSPHIVLREANIPFTLVKTDLKKKTTETGENFLPINPKGQVPTLQLGNGEVLTEGVAIVQYIASLVPEKELIPTGPGLIKYHQLEWLNFITAELHKGFSPLFSPVVSEDEKAKARAALLLKFNYLEAPLTKSTYLMGETFTAADAYLFTVCSWANPTKVTLPRFLTEYVARVGARPAVKAALEAEGLTKTS
ncbi:MAG TPA: glutathione transferase GstA [Bacteriovoracaceae bacterium]|nr:glutathione transferase GstA [Bacteriovoracaceae bacterium]